MRDFVSDELEIGLSLNAELARSLRTMRDSRVELTSDTLNDKRDKIGDRERDLESFR
jgi:hypothetical protein